MKLTFKYYLNARVRGDTQNCLADISVFSRLYYLPFDRVRERDVVACVHR